jgi:hypothetical protein
MALLKYFKVRIASIDKAYDKASDWRIAQYEENRPVKVLNVSTCMNQDFFILTLMYEPDTENYRFVCKQPDGSLTAL